MAVVHKTEDASGWPAIAYDCPGCRSRHVLRLRSPGVPDPTWTWNGNRDAPTIHPAVRTRHCSHYVRDGEIVYLSTSRHELAGQAAKMREV